MQISTFESLHPIENNIKVLVLRRISSRRILQSCDIDQLEALVVGLCAGLVQPTFADVAHPLHYIMVAVVELGLKHLEVAHLQT